MFYSNKNDYLTISFTEHATFVCFMCLYNCNLYEIDHKCDKATVTKSLR